MESGRIDEALREAITRSGENLSTIAHQSGVSLSSISRFAREERDLRLASAADLAQALQLELTQVQFMRRPADVHAVLEEVVVSTEERIEAIGGRSRYKPYLSSIEQAVAERSVSYRRLLTGYTISHELHEHLGRLLQYPRVAVRHTKDDHFGHLTVTDRETLLVLPAQAPGDFYGLRFSGAVHSRKFADYFAVLFDSFADDASRIEDDRDLSVRCGPCRRWVLGEGPDPRETS